MSGVLSHLGAEPALSDGFQIALTFITLTL